MFDRRNPSPSLLERAEIGGPGCVGVPVDEPALHALHDQPYAEPGTAAHRLNLMQGVLTRTAEAGRSTEQTVGALVDELHLLKARIEALERRLGH